MNASLECFRGEEEPNDKLLFMVLIQGASYNRYISMSKLLCLFFLNLIKDSGTNRMI